ncbi:biotin--[acetyl-CoA-carboxylase] ligase [Teredinibacter purpureus]|uniref:biotin--[acetyl-CoA-carboxylase] ligase n=1 Tax=Teredinibacter purpureus TaxID=2731756 RepID=UPI000ADFDCEC|nr:biotin--[acetyl-CoA-carboxylase] ligase [Teredinibacter purpureus]
MIGCVRMNEKQLLLVRCLADGEYHSGELLGQIAGVSRAAVWKQLQSLQLLGIEVVSQKGRGYVIKGGLALLSSAALQSALDESAQQMVSKLTILQQTDSTNQAVLNAVPQGAGHGLVVLAEQQTAGRGRRGRVWASPYGANIYLSVGWRFSLGAAALEGLSLAVGVAVAHALKVLGYPQSQLKWPNDVLVDGKKLGGILLEMTGDASGECYVVVGIGLNVRMPVLAGEDIGQPWVDLASLSCSEGGRDRSLIAAEILNQLLPLLAGYERMGFSPYRYQWEQLSAHQGQEVVLVTPSEQIKGVQLGVTDAGGVRLQLAVGERVFLGGEISLKAGS